MICFERQVADAVDLVADRVGRPVDADAGRSGIPGTGGELRDRRAVIGERDPVDLEAERLARSVLEVDPPDSRSSFRSVPAANLLEREDDASPFAVDPGQVAPSVRTDKRLPDLAALSLRFRLSARWTVRSASGTAVVCRTWKTSERYFETSSAASGGNQPFQFSPPPRQPSPSNRDVIALPFAADAGPVERDRLAACRCPRTCPPAPRPIQTSVPPRRSRPSAARPPSRRSASDGPRTDQISATWVKTRRTKSVRRPDMGDLDGWCGRYRIRPVVSVVPTVGREGRPRNRYDAAR